VMRPKWYFWNWLRNKDSAGKGKVNRFSMNVSLNQWRWHVTK